MDVRIFKPMSANTLTAPDLFRSLADPTRLRSLCLMQREGELCVCELTHALQESQPKISRHLAQLRELGVVLDRRQGHWVLYRINPDLPQWALQVIRTTTDGISQQEPFDSDLRALQGMKSRPAIQC